MGTCSLADDAVHASIMMPNHLPTTLALAAPQQQRRVRDWQNKSLSFPIMCIYDGCIFVLAAATRTDHTHAHLCLGLGYPFSRGCVVYGLQ